MTRNRCRGVRRQGDRPVLPRLPSLWPIASDAGGEAAKHCTDDLWGLAGYSKSGDQRCYDEGRARAKQSRRALRQAMREDLGVTAADPLPHKLKSRRGVCSTGAILLLSRIRKVWYMKR